jgi:hypothetical protein
MSTFDLASETVFAVLRRRPGKIRYLNLGHVIGWPLSLNSGTNSTRSIL